MWFFNPFFHWLVEQLRDPDVWFFLIGPGWWVWALPLCALIYLGGLVWEHVLEPMARRFSVWRGSRAKR